MGHNVSPWEHRGTALRLDGLIDVQACFHPPESEAEREARWQAMRQACWCTKHLPAWDP